MSGVTVDPYALTNSQNSFNLQSDGFYAGVFLDSPPGRYYLEGGQVGNGQTTPLYGGLPITALVPTPGPGGSSSSLGSTINLATAEGNVDGFTVFNQGSAGVITGSSNVPLYPANASVNFARIGCGLWLALPVKADDVDTLAGAGSNTAIYWDYTNNWVAAAGTGALGLQIITLNTNSMIVDYDGTAKTANWTAGPVIVVRL